MIQNNRIGMPQFLIPKNCIISYILKAKETMLGMENWRQNGRPTLVPFAITFPTLDPAQGNHHVQNEHHNYYPPIV